MRRLLHTIAICLLIAAVGYVYSIKYDIVYYTEQLAQLQAQIKQEHEYIALAQAEWQYLNNPERIRLFSERYLDLIPLSAKSIVHFSDLPKRPERTQDPIGKAITDFVMAKEQENQEISLDERSQTRVMP